ncbi:diguanylate cyclase [Alteromonas sp. W364]|uniref:diguanylate cyclase n=1 Tax=Alteromonas sp. W364 TaxID=3075610 RepID=UPI002886E94A|nr:diguanylate cyclase [Alteromonas sp. W364]MDT0629160.1 diguanylate cyclase [Alteromonas sp. W364]
MSVFRTVIIFIIISSAMLAGEVSAHTNEINTDIKLVNEQLHLFSDASSEMTINEAIIAFQKQQFSHNSETQVSFGFTQDTLWAVLPVINTSKNDDSLVIKIDNAWLDEVDVYYVHNKQILQEAAIGDSVPFTKRPISRRMPAVAYDFPPGQTDVYFRVHSKDPLTLPIYIGSEQSHVGTASINAYFYGALYGILGILFIYNIALFSYLKELKYLLYSLYLLAFTAFNYTYTGHGFWILWPESVGLQQLLMPTLMFAYLFSGVLFTLEFLNTRTYLPSLYAFRYKLYGALLILALGLLIIDDRSIAIMAQLIILTTLSIWMLVIGYYSYKSGNPLAMFFVPAVIMGTGGATISSLATWGVIPYSQWAFRGIEIGMLLEMSLLSISLGFNFKLAQEARKSAEINARLDQLTNLYNRRAFSDLVHPLWELGKRNKTPMAIILIDLDWFKRINDEYGHATGDEVLEEVGKELKKRLRESDIPLRWGGEEFLIFLPNTNTREAHQLADKLREHFDSKNITPEHKVTLSIGVVSALPHSVELDKLIGLADEALYQAKQNGRNCVVSLD